MVSAGKADQFLAFHSTPTQGPDLNSRQITIIIGKGEDCRTFYVHESLLTRHSGFFVAALRKEWKEAEERTVYLPDDESSFFETFARFVYTGRVFTFIPNDDTADKNNKEWGYLAKCWILGDKLSSTTFKDALCDALCVRRKTKGRHPICMHEIVYPSSANTAAIRSLLVDIAVWDWPVETIENRKMDESWNEFFKDLAVRLRKVSEKERNGTKPFENLECKYHEHVAASTPCYKTMF